MHKSQGFTLMEIIVVMIITGVLIAIAVPNYNTMMIQGSATAAANNLTGIYNAQKNYYFNHGSYCQATCDTLTDIDLPANLNLNITDTNFQYNCGFAGNFTCSATNNGDNNLHLTLTNSPIVLPGATGCTSANVANCNPHCYSDNLAYCPDSVGTLSSVAP